MGGRGAGTPSRARGSGRRLEMEHAMKSTSKYTLLCISISILGVGLLVDGAAYFLHTGGNRWPANIAYGRGMALAGNRRAPLQAFAVQVGRGAYGFVLIDPARQSLAVYRLDAGMARLRLMAARQYRYDLRLPDFNNAAPTPAQVKRLLTPAAPPMH